MTRTIDNIVLDQYDRIKKISKNPIDKFARILYRKLKNRPSISKVVNYASKIALDSPVMLTRAFGIVKPIIINNEETGSLKEKRD